jgi:hypothetical protein
MPWLRLQAGYSHRALWLIAAAIVLSRLLTALVFEMATIVNDSGVAIKFAGEPAYLDYGAYRAHMQTAWSELTRPFVFAQMLWSDAHKAWHWLAVQPLKPGPIFPALLHWTGYDDQRGLLSALYVLLGAVLGWIWALWVRGRGAAVWLQLLVACFPALVYYSFLVSTDLLYAAIVACWLISSWAVLDDRPGALRWATVAMCLALLTRPNALALLPLMSVLAWQGRTFMTWLLLSLMWALLGVYMLIYYLPYYWFHDVNAGATHYWGILPSDYYRGLWPEWPTWLSQPVSWLLFVSAKLLHAVGLRPSYANLDYWLVFLRALPGLLFLPGLLYGLCTARRFDRWFIFLFMLPVFVGAAQERYLLAISPLLVLWGVQVWERFARCVFFKVCGLGGMES